MSYPLCAERANAPTTGRSSSADRSRAADRLPPRVPEAADAADVHEPLGRERGGPVPLLLLRGTGGHDAGATPDVRDAGPHARHALADQAGAVPHAREPELRQPVRTVPRRAGDDHGRPLRRRGPADPLPRVAPGRPPARHARVDLLVQRRRDGRVRPRRVGAVLRLLTVRAARRPELLRVGRAVRALRQRVRLGAGAFVPQPPVLHRGTGGRRDEQPREHPDEAPERRAGLQELGLRRLRRGRLRLHAGRGRPHRTALDLLHVRHRGRAALEARHRLGLLLGRPVPGRLHLAGVLGDRARLRGPGVLGRAHLAGGRPAPRHRGRSVALGHVGRHHGSSSPITRRSARSTRTTG